MKLTRKVLNFIRNNTQKMYQDVAYDVCHGIDCRVEHETSEYQVVTTDVCKEACQLALENQWLSVEKYPLEDINDAEVIGYNKEWIDPDWNPNGTRVGFLNGNGEFTSAKWCAHQDCYVTCSEEGDDYILLEEVGNGKIKKTARYKDGKGVDGYVANMPTHYMLIPKHP